MCEYCEKNPRLLIKEVDKSLNGVGAKIEGGTLTMQIITDEWGALVHTPINFCPMCGRDLKDGE